MSALASVSGLAISRGGRMLFEGLDITVGAGEALHVTGPNGCGKSSLLRAIAGLLRPSAGTVETAPLALADDKLALDPELTLLQALTFWIKLDGSPERLAAALDTLELARLAAVPVRYLSTGQKKRATLARVGASGARLWLLDEPLNGLDTQGVDDLARLIDAHRSSGGAVIAASHAPLPGTWRTLELKR